ncbi:Uncharacterised protein [uncultured archaeon]|nr:Uncharacterised protein [uncultured archaeon]
MARRALNELEGLRPVARHNRMMAMTRKTRRKVTESLRLLIKSVNASPQKHAQQGNNLRKCIHWNSYASISPTASFMLETSSTFIL